MPEETKPWIVGLCDSHHCEIPHVRTSHCLNWRARATDETKPVEREAFERIFEAMREPWGLTNSDKELLGKVWDAALERAAARLREFTGHEVAAELVEALKGSRR